MTEGRLQVALKIGAAVAAVALVLAFVALGIDFHDRADRVEAARDARIESDYRLCLTTNELLAAQRAQADVLASPTPIDASIITNAELRALVLGLQARGRQYRAEWVPKLQPHDCPAERQAAINGP